MKPNVPQIIVFFIGLVLLAVAGLAVAGSIIGESFEPWQVVLGFFEGYTPEQIILGAVLGILTIIPGAGTKVLNWLKESAGLTGNKANTFIVFCSACFAAVALLITGTLNLEGVNFNLANIVAYGSLIYTLSQVAYKAFMQESSAAHKPGVI